jgi:hypothetical protein
VRGGDFVAVGDSVFDLREACGCAGDRGPVRWFVGEKGVVDVAKAVGAAAQGGAKIGGNGKSRQYLIDGAIQKSVGDREQAHKEQIGALGRNADGLRNGSQKKARVSAVRMSSGGLSPAMTTMTTMETQRRNSVSPRSANGVAHAAKAEQRGIEITRELVNDGRVVLKQGLDFIM